tara:strand:+ start:39 stop:203 length:165 start_codon:yes stop_codon:yes gene_type:complete
MTKVLNKVKDLLNIEYNLFAIYAIVMTGIFLYGMIHVIISLFQGNASNIPYDVF